MSSPFTKSDSAFHTLLRQQIRHEFTASQQYIATAVYFDSGRLPQLARRFYAQATDERRHAMMMVQYLLDRDLPVEVTGLDDVTATFESVQAAVAHALDMEKQVTGQITALSRSARETGDYLGEQFMQWFLQEQVDEVARMTTLLTVIERAAGNTFDIEEFVARESTGPGSAGAAAPKAAGGGV